MEVAVDPVAEVRRVVGAGITYHACSKGGGVSITLPVTGSRRDRVVARRATELEAAIAVLAALEAAEKEYQR